MVGDGAGSGRVWWADGCVSWCVGSHGAAPSPHRLRFSLLYSRVKKQTNKKKGIMGNKSICVAEALTLYSSIWKRIFIHFYGLFFNFWF